jgi:hypothetical protein
MLQPEVLDLRERTREIVDLVTRSLREDIRIVFATSPYQPVSLCQSSFIPCQV